MLFWLDDLVNLLYPEVCAACNNGLFKGEHTLCTHCLYHLPITNFHKSSGNPVEKQFWGKVPIQAATSLFYFNKGERVQQLIHRLKYHGDKEVGAFTGRLLGKQLLSSTIFSTVDIIVPVPLHKSKLRLRGFNQADFFGSGLAEVMNIPCLPDFLIKLRASSTQTNKTRFMRFENVDKLFGVNEKYPKESRHFLLVDDVITTGSTLASCATSLLEIPGARVSIATIAYARL